MKKYFSWISEALVIVLMLFFINNYLEHPDLLIKADGKGYYDYLPAAFIYHDLNFTYTDTLQTEYYDQKTYSSGYLHRVNGRQINKYFPGVAVLWTPFFLVAHWYALHSSDYAADGYSLPYQKSIFYAAVFYLFLGLFFLRKLLEEFSISPSLIFCTQVLIVLATPLIHYVHFEPAFTHVYSFTLITGFAYCMWRYVHESNRKHLFFAAILYGLIVIIRPVNGLSLAMLLFCFSSWNECKSWFITSVFRNWKAYVAPLGIFLLIVSIVPFMWFYQTGNFLVWGYQNEGFNFSSPAFFPFLFSFQKGAFLLTPILLVALIGGMWALITRKKWFQVSAIIGFIILIVYVLSSWWSWWYGASFGSRPLIDFYVIFALLFALFLHQISRLISKIVIGIILLSLTGVNLIQARQYQTYIIDWSYMDFEKYAIIGLHTEEKYRGIFYRPMNSYSDEEVVFSTDFSLESKEIGDQEIYFFPTQQLDSLNENTKFNFVYLESDMEFEDGSAEVILVGNTLDGTNVYWHSQSVFGSVLKENVRQVVRLPYQIPTGPSIREFTIGCNSKTDRIKIHTLRAVFVLRE